MIAIEMMLPVRRLVLEILLVTLGFWWGVRNIPFYPAGDFFQFWAPKHALASPEIENIYVQEDADLIRGMVVGHAKGPIARASNVWTARSKYSATPFFYASLAPFWTNDFDRDHFRFRLFSLLVFLLAVVVMARTFQLRWYGLFILIPLVVGFNGPLVVDIVSGNAGQIQVAMFACILWFMGRTSRACALAGGVVLATALAFKPTFLFAVPIVAIIMIVEKYDRAPYWILGGMIVAPFLYFWPDFVFDGKCGWAGWMSRYPVEYGERSSYFFRSGSVPISPGFIVGAVVVVVAVLRKRAQWSGRPRMPESACVVAFLLGLCVTCLAMPFVWSHYFLHLTPVAVYFWARPLNRFVTMDLVSKVAGSAGALLGLSLLVTPDRLAAGFAGVILCSLALLADLHHGFGSIRQKNVEGRIA